MTVAATPAGQPGLTPIEQIEAAGVQVVDGDGNLFGALLTPGQDLFTSEQSHRSMGNPRFLIELGDGIAPIPSRVVIEIALAR